MAGRLRRFVNIKCYDVVHQICVPRSDTVSRLKLGRNDFESHVLIPCSEDGVSYRSVNNKVILINAL